MLSNISYLEYFKINGPQARLADFCMESVYLFLFKRKDIIK